MIDYIRSNLEEIPLRQLSDIIHGIAFVYHFQRRSVEACAKDLLADLNGENLLKAWTGDKRQQPDEGRETRAKQPRPGRHPNELLNGEGRIMDIRKLIELNKARLDFLSSQQGRNGEDNVDPLNQVDWVQIS